MNRRKFLRFLGIGAGTVAAAPVIAKIPVPGLPARSPAMSVMHGASYGAASDSIAAAIGESFRKTKEQIAANVFNQSLRRSAPAALWPGVRSWFDKKYRRGNLRFGGIFEEDDRNA